MNRHVFRQRWVRIISLIVYLGVPALIVALALPGDTGAEPWWIVIVGWLLFFLLPLIWVYRTKLELSAEGVLLCEGVFTLEAPWKSVVALDRTLTREGFVLREALPAKGAARLRFWAGANRIVPTGALKHGEQRHRWIGQGRFIPLQAFSRIVQSPEFERLLLACAPHVELLTPARLQQIGEDDDRHRNIWTFE